METKKLDARVFRVDQMPEDHHYGSHICSQGHFGKLYKIITFRTYCTPAQIRSKICDLKYLVFLLFMIKAQIVYHVRKGIRRKWNGKRLMLL